MIGLFYSPLRENKKAVEILQLPTAKAIVRNHADLFLKPDGYYYSSYTYRN